MTPNSPPGGSAAADDAAAAAAVANEDKEDKEEGGDPGRAPVEEEEGGGAGLEEGLAALGKGPTVACKGGKRCVPIHISGNATFCLTVAPPLANAVTALPSVGANPSRSLKAGVIAAPYTPASSKKSVNPTPSTSTGTVRKRREAARLPEEV